MDLSDRAAGQSCDNIQRSLERDPEDLEQHPGQVAVVSQLRSCYQWDGTMVSYYQSFCHFWSVRLHLILFCLHWSDVVYLSFILTWCIFITMQNKSGISEILKQSTIAIAGVSIEWCEAHCVCFCLITVTIIIVFQRLFKKINPSVQT